MLRTKLLSIVVLSLLMTVGLSSAAAAQDKPEGDAAADLLGESKPADAAAGDDSSAVLPDQEVEVGGAEVGDSVGGATGFVFKQGFYTQSEIGGFFTFGNVVPGVSTGFTINRGEAGETACGTGIPCKPVLWSQLQPFIGLSIGYDLFQWLGIQVSYGTGFVANAAIYNNAATNPRDYGLTMINVAVVGSFYVLERLAIMAKLQGGVALITPEPAPLEPTLGGNIGLGIGVRYATLLPDVFVGLDLNGVAGLLPTSGGGLVMIPGVSITPVIKYVF
jgi:hypothetical protein